ncbi:Uncharacterized membrane protein YqjE [Humidesulfovibrio mexicanus]|uniref:Uncharacterized membrane protein YqjE n=1 Tax=Humidesulfovibrio mexicanus TaxID=147047 RepID=A0A238ZZA6_9BACT|nr:phage holin family protein [Humidesulfovibrio mexicanus]SNR88482.1 Uncharacterized membrane protein YqjE [Humidesulfovibrio mexicanus]
MSQLLEELDLGGASGRVAEALVQTAKDRVELLGIELREDKIRLVQALILACAGVVLGLMALVLGVLALLAVLPEFWRAPAMGFVALVCAVAAVWAFGALRSKIAGRGRLFAQTLDELEKDKTCFSTRN